MAVTAADKEKKIEDGIWRLVDGRYYVELRPGGRTAPKVKRTCVRLEQARAFKKSHIVKVENGEKTLKTKDKRRLSDLVIEWQSLYGYTLKDKERHLVLLATCKLLGDPVAQTFTAEDFMVFRKMRIETVQPGKGGKTISANTVNHAHAYLSAVFGRLKQLGKWDYPNPLAGLPKLKVEDPGLIYLDQSQIKLLLSALEYAKNPDLLMITKICLSIGSRWGEAAALQAQQVKGGRIQLVNTKSGKSRSIPISPEFQDEILASRPKFGRLFEDKSAKKGFSNALKRAGIELPAGQMTHVLRHTFASFFMMNDGNILKLKEILGHASLDMTMRYAHLSPSHLTQAITHNPLATIAVAKTAD
jgi:integrase